jgi:hypothetical protein
MRVTRSAIMLLALAAAVHADPARARLDLDGAVAYAASHHPTTRADAATVHAAEDSVDIDRAKYVGTS